MNWGKGLALTLLAFIGLMAWFLVMAARSPESLVTEQYYEQELRYQDRIDDMERAHALTEAVHMEVSGHSIRLIFPPEFRASRITGELTLLRPNDPAADKVLPVTADGTGSFEAVGLDLVPGRYNASLAWAVEGVSYFTTEKLVVP